MCAGCGAPDAKPGAWYLIDNVPYCQDCVLSRALGRKDSPGGPQVGLPLLAPQAEMALVPRRLSDRTRGALLALAGEGVNKWLIAWMLAANDVHRDHVRYYVGPVITQRGGEQALPLWLCRAITIERMETILAEHEAGYVGDLATLSEAAAVLLTASDTYPLRSEWVDIHGWVCSQVYDRFRSAESGTTFAAALGEEPVEPDSHQRRALLAPLQRSIRRDVVRGATPPKARVPVPHAPRPERPGRRVQLSMFGDEET